MQRNREEPEFKIKIQWKFIYYNWKNAKIAHIPTNKQILESSKLSVSNITSVDKVEELCQRLQNDVNILKPAAGCQFQLYLSVTGRIRGEDCNQQFHTVAALRPYLVSRGVLGSTPIMELK